MKSKTIMTYLALCIILASCKSLEKVGESKKDNAYFEGKVIYELSYIPKSKNISKEQADLAFGTEQTYTISGNKYKNEMNGSLGMSQYYLGMDTLYVTTNMSKELLWVDATYINDEVISTELIEDAEVVNGINCNLLIINSTKGSFKYYFNSEYKIDPMNYENHRVGFWDICINQTNSLMLKSILDTKEEYVELNAIDIQKVKINDSEFELPNLIRKRFPINKRK